MAFGVLIDKKYMAVMGQLACYSGKQVTWEQMMAADFEFERKVADTRHDSAVVRNCLSPSA